MRAECAHTYNLHMFKHSPSALVLLLSLLLWTQGASFAQDFQKGKDAFRTGDYATAFKEFQGLAEKGDAAAQHNLGVIYQQGHG